MDSKTKERQTYDETETSRSTSLTVLHDDALERVSKGPTSNSCAVASGGGTNVDDIAVSGEGLYIRKQRRDKRESQTET